MAGTKKKKKPAANPARGFATTSIASKSRLEAGDALEQLPPTNDQPSNAHLSSSKNIPPSTRSPQTVDQHGCAAEALPLSPEEFERQLEESELQIFVEKHSQKTKRDAHRQCAQLETNRRLLRSQAESLQIHKWLPQELMNHILDLIKAESRFSVSGLSSESTGSEKMPSEEDLTVRLWVLQQTLSAVAFPEPLVQDVLQYILDVSPSISTASKEFIWGLEEALDWLARECSFEDLPFYKKMKSGPKDTSSETPNSSRTNTARPGDSHNSRGGKNDTFNQPIPKTTSKSGRIAVTYDSDIEPEDLISEYISAKAKLLELSRSHSVEAGSRSSELNDDFETAKLEAKLRRIESDVLFDKSNAEQKWKKERVLIEKKLAATRKVTKGISDNVPRSNEPFGEVSLSDEINAEAERMAAQILSESKGDDDIAGLFDSLPQSQVDPVSGQMQTMINSSNGTKVLLRDFGKWTGVSPRRVLEEACRSRDPSVKITYTAVSETAFANRHRVDVSWTKPQEVPAPVTTSMVEIVIDPLHLSLTMLGVSAPDIKQSEAYAATSALFYIFNTNPREEKVHLRLPPVWRDLWIEMSEAKKSYSDAQDRSVVKRLRDLVRARQDRELEDGVILQGAFRGRGSMKSLSEAMENGNNDRLKQSSAGDDALKKLWTNKVNSMKYQAMLKYRMQLPMWSFKSHVLDAVENNQVVIVCGETGCGKSTQVPAFLLEHELSRGNSCKIYCTEPRRISAISLARRVSEELGENKNDLGTIRSLVGYSIRLEANTSKETRLIYATTGIVMRMLEGSSDLQEVTHLVLDEVHERSIDSDFLLIVLKRLLKRRPDLKVVLMSATVDAERFSAYLSGAPILNVPGHTFPVEVRYLEDAIELTGYTPSNSKPEKLVDVDEEVEENKGSSGELSHSLPGYSAKTRAVLAQVDEYYIDFDLIVHLLAHVATNESLQPYSTAILVFLPGIAEIRTLNDLILGDPCFSKNWLIYPLHSSIATEDQEAAFLVPPQAVRKIVLATNIAETGITIPDVTCVIDTGKHREMRYDEKKQLSRLIDTFISRANAKQRRGRAGRVQNGLCFHMFTKHRHDNIMSDQQNPEMLRLSLQDLAIRVKICKLGGIEETLGDALDAPSTKNIRRAIDALIDVRALTANEDLTPLGYQLARLPLDVFLGKLILYGCVFKCLDMALTLAAISSSKSPFSAAFGQRAQAVNARAAFRRADSDLLTTYNAYLSWKRLCQSNSGLGKEFQFCRKNFLSQQTLANIEDLKGQLLVSLADSGFLSLTEEERRALFRLRSSSGGRGRRQQQFIEVPQRVNINSDNDVISASVIAWSFYPKLLVRDLPATKGLRNISNNQSISLHPSSVNRNLVDSKWFSYYHIIQTKSVYRAHETTATDSFAIALLCGDVRCDMYSGVIVLDGNRGRFAVPDWKSMLVIKFLRMRLRELLTKSFKQPGKLPTAQQEKWLDVWQRLFSQDFSQDRSSTTINIANM